MKTLLSIMALLLCSPCWAAITHVATGCTTKGNPVATSGHFSFSCTPNAANDAVLFGVECSSASSLTNVTLAATGWTITRLDAAAGSAPFGSGTAGWMGVFGAIAPNTSATTFTATYTGDAGGNCGNFTFYGADEFAGNDTTGGTTTFDASAKNGASTSCGLSVTPANNNDAVWFACTDSLPASNWAGTGFSGGVNDGGGEATIYEILTGGSGAAQAAAWSGASGTVPVGGASVKPAGGGGSTPCQSALATLGVGSC